MLGCGGRAPLLLETGPAARSSALTSTIQVTSICLAPSGEPAPTPHLSISVSFTHQTNPLCYQTELIDRKVAFSGQVSALLSGKRCEPLCKKADLLRERPTGQQLRQWRGLRNNAVTPEASSEGASGADPTTQVCHKESASLLEQSKSMTNPRLPLAWPQSPWLQRLNFLAFMSQEGEAGGRE